MYLIYLKCLSETIENIIAYSDPMYLAGGAFAHRSLGVFKSVTLDVSLCKGCLGLIIAGERHALNFTL